MHVYVVVSQAACPALFVLVRTELPDFASSLPSPSPSSVAILVVRSVKGSVGMPFIPL